MKIVHITSLHHDNDNRIFYKECTSLAQEGYDVILIAAGAKDKVVNNVKIVGYPKTSGGRIKRILKTSMADMLKMCRHIDGDIYHFHDPELMFVGLYLKALGKTVVYDIHENNPASILSKPYIKSKSVKKMISRVFDLFEHFSVRFFDAIVTARPDITKRFKHKNIITLRNFPILSDLSKIQNKTDIKKTKPAVIYVGGMHTQRGTFELIEAFKKLKEYELWLLGTANEDKLQNILNKGCENVKYFGSVEPYEIFDYINMADAGIITFLEEPNHINTLATKPFEYMACGKPMIMSNFPYWKNFFKKSALYVDPSSPKEIREAVKTLLNDKKLMQEMSELNQNLSQNEYNWQKESQKLIDLYKKLEK
jgi:glycosyltransferase involved in cell wall biosynthesis